METTALRFIYTNAKRETREHVVTGWSEVGHYIEGFSQTDQGPRTFRKDRVDRYLDGCEALLTTPNSPPPPRIQRESKSDERPQVLFTGFAKAARAALEGKANDAGLRVVSMVTQGLVFLCCGPNAGPSKVEKARAQDVYVLNEGQFHVLLETGELLE